MNDFITATKIPKWRIAFWAVVGIAVSSWMAHSLGEERIFWAALIGIPVLITLMLGIFRFTWSPWARRNVGLILWTYIILQSVWLLWRIFEK